MVYAVRSDLPMITKKALKKTRKIGRHEQIREFLCTHSVSFARKDDTSGEMVAVVKEKKK